MCQHYRNLKKGGSSVDRLWKILKTESSKTAKTKLALGGNQK